MREFATTIKGMQTGLRKFFDAPVNSPGLYQLYNAVCTERGLRAWIPPGALDLTGSGITIEPPYPQIFKGSRNVLMATDDTLYSINPATYGITALTLYDGYDSPATKVITADGVWDFIDFGSTFMLFNGTSWVYRSGHAGIVGDTDKTYIVNTPTITSGCKFRGRAVFGGFPNGAWNATWKASMQALMQTNTGVAFNLDDIDGTYVWWTTVGGGDLFWHVYPELAMTGALDMLYDPTNPYFVQHWQRNDWGFMPMEFNGAVVRIMPMEDAVVVFGEDGTCIMPYVPEMTTFGKYRANVPAIQQRGACAVSNSKLIFIDNANELWQFGREGFQNVGYSEYLATITDGIINIIYDESEDNFYITGEDACFCYNDYGMSQVGRVLTGFVNGFGTPRVGTYLELGDAGAEDPEFLCVSNVFDGGTRAVKTLMQIEVGLTSGSMDTVTVAVDYRYKHNTAFSRTAFVPINAEGFAQLPVSGLEFRVVVRSTDYANTVLDYVRYSIQFDDARTTFGLKDNVDQSDA